MEPAELERLPDTIQIKGHTLNKVRRETCRFYTNEHREYLTHGTSSEQWEQNY
jgi:hypothetical protein